MYKKLCELVGVESPCEPCRTYCLNNNNIKANCRAKVFIADKQDQLEELVLNVSQICIRKDKYVNDYDYCSGIISKEDSFISSSWYKTRSEALCVLVIKLLDADVLKKNDVKKILEFTGDK